MLKSDFVLIEQTFNNNFTSAEKSPIFKPHKPYTNSLANIK